MTISHIVKTLEGLPQANIASQHLRLSQRETSTPGSHPIPQCLSTPSPHEIKYTGYFTKKRLRVTVLLSSNTLGRNFLSQSWTLDLPGRSGSCLCHPCGCYHSHHLPAAYHSCQLSPTATALPLALTLAW